MSAWHGGPCRWCDEWVWVPIGVAKPEGHEMCRRAAEALAGGDGAEEERGEE